MDDGATTIIAIGFVVVLALIWYAIRYAINNSVNFVADKATDAYHAYKESSTPQVPRLLAEQYAHLPIGARALEIARAQGIAASGVQAQQAAGQPVAEAPLPTTSPSQVVAPISTEAAVPSAVQTTSTVVAPASPAAPAPSAEPVAPAAATSSAHVSKLCPMCGSQVGPQARFCARCGSPVSPTVQPSV